MPVTAKLSRAFYDKFGDAITDELVDWFNQVDLTYRTELRELNDLNFARFDAKVGERLAELRSSIEATLRAEMDRRFGTSRAEMDGQVTTLRAGMDDRFTTLRAGMDDQFTTLRAELDQRFARVDQRFEVVLDKIRDAKTSMIKWMFGFWIGTALVILGSRLAQ
jgi:hypothetical protein